jgi:hypothetical protein
MTRSQQNPSSVTVGLVIMACLFIMLVTAIAAQAQTLTVLHTFTGSPDGAGPGPGLTAGGATLYGTTEYGGNLANCDGSCGTVFKTARSGSGWIETPIYKFTGVPDGANPMGRVIVGPDGALYGTTVMGGTGPCDIGSGGCGTVFKLQPPPTFCASFLCEWRETILYDFASYADGAWPEAEIVFDQAGNIYGSTGTGGTGPCGHGAYSGCGTIFKLTPNGHGSWSKSTLYSFQGAPNDGEGPGTGLVLDQAGNVYGTTAGGGLQCPYDEPCGVVFRLTPSGSQWQETILYFFTGGSDGYLPGSGLISDGHGNLFGAAAAGGQGIDGGNGTVFELTPAQGGGWNFSVQYTFNYYNNEAEGPGPLTMDTAGNIYGTSGGGGAYGSGTAYKLTASSGGWTYTTLYSFGFDGSTGFFPEGKIVLDAGGNLYSTCSQGPYPSPDDGTVWEVTL